MRNCMKDQGTELGKENEGHFPAFVNTSRQIVATLHEVTHKKVGNTIFVGRFQV